MLEKIKRKEVIVSLEEGNDRIDTFLALNDYDWMTYTLNSVVATKSLGILDITFEYCGSIESTMEVIQCDLETNNLTSYTYAFNTEMFMEYLTKFLTSHIASYKDEYAFYGGDLVIEWFNDVIENHNSLIDERQLPHSENTKHLKYLSDALKKNSYEFYVAE